ncbi:MAG: glycosyl hydrolase 115 family protein, partial [Bacteroidales bacterium]
NEFPGVERVMGYFRNDLRMVSGKEPMLYKGEKHILGDVIIAGTLGQSELIDKLVNNKKVDLSALSGKNEMFLIQVVEKPFEGVDKALVIAGSDKRGTIYGVFEVSKQIGVSPWYWWADVPVEQHANLYFRRGIVTEGEPKVTYRGIFLNDEEPSLGRWAVEKFGGFNAGFYEKLFELMLRLKANFLWPAMWWASFNSNDLMNPVLADELGIVMGTSHHEPMNRAHADWQPYGGKEWNYETNARQLRQFWTEGIQRTQDFETVITLGMRGDGDMAMSNETNIALLEQIVKDQREIIAGVTEKEITKVPQVWALYKEVQDYYDRGMRVPEDVILLFCDDNWGNIRSLPKPDEPAHKGGYGIYYHFDYVGGPRNYKWINTSQIQRIWEQMNLAYLHGVNEIWITNVGDLKPMEFPIEFFLDMAWDPDRFNPEGLFDYTSKWAEYQFGKEFAGQIADLIDRYTRFNSRRKPELLESGTYSHLHYKEAIRVAEEYNQLVNQSNDIYQKLPEKYHDAYYQLVQYPVEACATINDMYITTGQNLLFAKQGRVIANELALEARKLYEKDSLMSLYYNKNLAGGKWNNMMNQTRIGYTTWQQPASNKMPKVEIVNPLEGAHMGVAVEGSDNWWPNCTGKADLPQFDIYNRQRYYFDIFNRGNTPFIATINTGSKLISVSEEKVEVVKHVRIWVDVNWKEKITELTRTPITVNGPGAKKVVIWAVINPLNEINPKIPGFVEANGYVAIEAGNVSRIVAANGNSWQVLPGFGRTNSGIMPVPVTMKSLDRFEECASIEYDMQLTTKGEVTVNLILAPTLNIYNNQGLRVAVSFNDAMPVVLNMHDWQTFQDWEESVRKNSIILKSNHLVKAGKNVLKIWAMDPAVVLQKIIVDTGGLKPSYLGPPESYVIR